MRKIAGILVILFLMCGMASVSFAQTPKTAGAKEGKPSVDVIKGTITSIDTAKNEIVVKESKTGAEKTIVVDPTIIAPLKVKDKVRVTLKSGSNVAEKVKVIPPVIVTNKSHTK
jgi:hypothetical protein